MSCRPARIRRGRRRRWNEPTGKSELTVSSNLSIPSGNEAYTPRQLAHGTGGPPTAELMMDVETLRTEFAGLDLLDLRECEREINEGAFHNGLGAVVQMVGRKP